MLMATLMAMQTVRNSMRIDPDYYKLISTGKLAYAFPYRNMPLSDLLHIESYNLDVFHIRRKEKR